MFEHMTEQEAKDAILQMVGAYCDKYHNQKKCFEEGDRIPYASRVYDRTEMTNLVDSALEFWLTSGRYTDEFEENFARYLGIRFCSPGKLGFFRQSAGIYGADLPASRRSSGKAGR